MQKQMEEVKPNEYIQERIESGYFASLLEEKKLLQS